MGIVIGQNKAQEVKEDIDQDFVHSDSVLSAVSEEIISITRAVPNFDGIYVEGILEDLELTFTVDTAATRTLVSYDLYSKI